MRILRLAALSCGLVAGCTFGVKTCSPTDPCLGEGQCEDGVCVARVKGGGDGGDAGATGGGSLGGGGGSTGGGTGGGSVGGGGGATGGGGGATGGGGGATGGGSASGGGSPDAGPFDAGPLEGVVFLTPPRIAVAGSCSPAIRIGVFEDAGINEADGGVSPLVITRIDVDSAFYEDGACTIGPQTEFTIPDSGVVEVHFKAMFSGSLLVLATHTFGTDVQQVQHVVGAAPSRLFLGPSMTVAAGACSAAVEVRMRDAFGNFTTSTTAITVGLSSTASTTRFFSANDSSCISPLAPAQITMPAGADVSFFRFSDTTRGLPGVTADAGPGAVGAVTQEQTVL